MMFRSSTTFSSQLTFAEKSFLGNASIVAEQTEVGILVKPNTVGYTAFMLDFLEFAEDTGIEDEVVMVTLDYVLVNK